jgi:predicted DNA-binding transcriptional regulator AlpA
MSSNLLTPKQLAELLAVNENTLAKWRLIGGGPKFIRVQRSIRYADNDVDQWLDQRKFQSTTEADHYALILKEAA